MSAPTPEPNRTTVILAGHSGDAATARAGLVSGDPAIRAAALSALQRIGVLTPVELLSGITDTNPVVAARAADLSAQELAEPAIDAALIALLSHQNSDIAEVGAWALGERHQQPDPDADPNFARPRPQATAGGAQTTASVVDALITTATDHADALVRESATAALGCIGDPRSLPAILRACTDKATVRRRAVIALAAFEGPEVDAALEHARSDRDWQVRQAAEDLLA
jgi:HEAT repeat protein